MLWPVGRRSWLPVEEDKDLLMGITTPAKLDNKKRMYKKVVPVSIPNDVGQSI